MRRKRWLGLLALALAAGCSGKSEPHVPPPAPEAEKAVRARVAALQKIIKDRDADKLWGMLDDRSQTDAEQAAKALREEYDKADAGGQKKLAEKMGVAADGLKGLTARGFLKTTRFWNKYDELKDATLKKLNVRADDATASLNELDGDTEKVIFVRRGGEWKVWLPMPKKDRVGH